MVVPMYGLVRVSPNLQTGHPRLGYISLCILRPAADMQQVTVIVSGNLSEGMGRTKKPWSELLSTNMAFDAFKCLVNFREHQRSLHSELRAAGNLTLFAFDMSQESSRV